LAQSRRLAGCLNLRKVVTNEPYRSWGPSLAAPPAALRGNPDLPPHKVHYKVVADVTEALVGAFLVDGGPAAADALLGWLGLPLPCAHDACTTTTTTIPPAGHLADSEGWAWPLRLKACQCW
jgi:hypothetical protein